jgi:muramidase (phage lysozyme)
MAKRQLRSLRWLRLRMQRLFRRHKRQKLAVLATLVAVVVGALTLARPEPTPINPTAYTPLLSVIAEGESSGNYNAHYGNSANDTLRFTDMPVGAVLDWQEKTVSEGSPSSAVGRYQIVRPTLVKLVQQLNIEPSAPFDETLQDRLAIALLEKRGSQAYVNRTLSREQFAANLAQEWAALPRVTGPNPQDSYYAGDGLNASRVSTKAVFEALDALALNAQR